MGENEVVANHGTILDNQEKYQRIQERLDQILTNQETIQRNQERVDQTLVNLERIMRKMGRANRESYLRPEWPRGEPQPFPATQ